LDIPDDIKLFDEYWGENNNLWCTSLDLI